MRRLILIGMALALAIPSTARAADKPAPTAATLLAKLKAAKLPIGASIVYTEATDTNELLGRPGGYISKASWRDTRVPKPYEPFDVDGGGTIEVYATERGAKARYDYMLGVIETTLITQWIYRDGKAVLRVSRTLTSKQAVEYLAAIKRP